MGTNYYLHRDVCECCGRGDGEPYHIGKSSAGWCFALHVAPDGLDWGDGPKISDLDDWRELWAQPKTVIIDEYGQPVTPEDMESVIVGRERDDSVWERTPMGYDSWLQFHQMNHSEKGPKGLLRHKIEGGHCIKHGVGTWDCILGEFS